MKAALLTALAAFAAATGFVQTQSNYAPTAQPMMGQGMMGQGMMGHGMMMGSMLRHHQAMMYGIPEPYRFARNPLPNSAATLQHGAQVYAANCAACHGSKGYGDGPAAAQLSPRPADLAWLSRSHMVGDQYIYWTVADGGQPVGSAMPAFKKILSQRDIWAVVTYVRHGMPAGR
jgi:mono/diheme cytochrome c family protein